MTERNPSIEIREVTDRGEKTAVTLKIMHALPLWFSPPEDIDRKAVLHRDFAFFAAFDGAEAVGFAALKRQTPFALDIYSLGVLEPYHRTGIGRRLIARAEDFCQERGYLFLTVKTLDGACAYGPYERTRAFYLQCGFVPLEVFPTLWNEQNPCLFLAKTISPAGIDSSPHLL